MACKGTESKIHYIFICYNGHDNRNHNGFLLSMDNFIYVDSYGLSGEYRFAYF